MFFLFNESGTFLLITDEHLEGDSSLHFNWHLIVINETVACELQGRL